jgi:hypothetical protein
LGCAQQNGWGVVVFIAEKNEREGRRKNEGRKKEGYLSSHKLNIIDEFIDKFKSMDLNLLIILYVKMTHHHTSQLFFPFFLFPL